MHLMIQVKVGGACAYNNGNGFDIRNGCKQQFYIYSRTPCRLAICKIHYRGNQQISHGLAIVSVIRFKRKVALFLLGK